MKSPVTAPLAAFAYMIVLFFTSASTQAASENEPDHATAIAYIQEQFGATLGIQEVVAVEGTGFYRLRLADGNLIFTDSKASGFFIGDVFSFTNGRFVNQSEALLNKERFATITEIPVADMIVFPALAEKIGDMYVFTDIDCGYCRKLHKEIDIYQKSGVEVRYIAWPRCGVGIQCGSYTKAVHVWCAEDQQQAMTDAKADRPIKAVQCDNPVAEQFGIGRELGIRGTPFIMLSNGVAIPGYKSAGEIVSLF